MRIDDALYRSFLQEMEGLDAFRLAYRDRYPETPLDRDDPDVRRLIEAMALFSARTRLASQRQMDHTHRRMFQQFFPWLMTPLPAMGVVQAKPTAKLAEPISLPEGTVLGVYPEGGNTALFETLAPMNLLPVDMKEVQAARRDSGETLLRITLSSSYPRNDLLGRLSLFVNHLGDYGTSLNIHSSLARHLSGVSVQFGESEPLDCEVHFGEMPGSSDTLHPLEKERLFFHFPWQELFIHVDVPQPDKAWQTFTLTFELDSAWPGGVNLSRELFHLFAVPVLNIREDRARPVIAKGTQESVLLMHPDMEKGYRLHSVKGVYEVTPEGLSPIDPNILSDSAPSWESQEEMTSDGRRVHRLGIHFPDAFEEPRTLSITARWIQPWFSDAVGQRHDVWPWSRETAGVSWAFAEEPVPHGESPLHQNEDAFLRFLTLTNRVALTKNDLTEILLALGLTHKSHFAPVLHLLSDVRTETSARQLKGSGVVTCVYTLEFHEHGAELAPLVDLFIKHVAAILDAWVAAVRVEVRRSEETA